MNNNLLVLIEGLDCSGKKIIAEKVQSLLKRDAINAVINKGSLYHSFISRISNYFTTKALLGAKEGFLVKYVKSFIYFLEPLIDRLFFQHPDNQVVIQVSSYFRSVSWSLSRHKFIYYYLGKLFLPLYIKYNIIFYITSDYKTRIRRHLKMHSGKILWRRFSSRSFYEKQEEILFGLLFLNGGSNVHVFINESSNDLDQIVIKIHKEIVKYLK